MPEGAHISDFVTTSGELSGAFAVPGLGVPTEETRRNLSLTLVSPYGGQSARVITSRTARAQSVQIPLASEGLEGALFRNRATLKILTSQVAMHLKGDERTRLFAAIDRLLDLSEWDDESSQIDTQSFRSYLRFLIYASPRRVANLGVGPEGAVLAAWRKDGKSVHVEFFKDDQCMALIKGISDRGPETLAVRAHVARVRELIANSGALDCLDQV